MNTVLVTGCAGNIGSSLCAKLLEEGYEVIGVDDLSTGKNQIIHCNFTFYEFSISDSLSLEGVFQQHNISYVFNFAAIVGVLRTVNNPLLVLNDFYGLKSICELSVKYEVKRIFYSSSSEVYGEPVEHPQNEISTPLNCRLPYAVMKNVGECFLRAFNQEKGLNYTIFRFFNTYGPNQSEDFVIMKLLQKALKNEPLTIYGDGQQTRSFLYIQDNIDTMYHCMLKERYVNDTLNIGSNIETTIYDLAKKIIKVTNSQSNIEFLPSLEAGDMRRRCADNKKMLTVLQRDLISLENGLVATMAYLNEN